MAYISSLKGRDNDVEASHGEKVGTSSLMHYTQLNWITVDFACLGTGCQKRSVRALQVNCIKTGHHTEHSKSTVQQRGVVVENHSL